MGIDNNILTPDDIKKAVDVQQYNKAFINQFVGKPNIIKQLQLNNSNNSE